MKNHTNIRAFQCKDYGNKKTLKCKEDPKHDSMLFFHAKKYCTLANPELAFLYFLGLATASNLSF